MCGIFGYFGYKSGNISVSAVDELVHSARQRGKDSSGMIFGNQASLEIHRADFDINKLWGKTSKKMDWNFLCGHSRLITNSMTENQPVFLNSVLVIHNGIICNTEAAWKTLDSPPSMEIDTEIIAFAARKFYDENNTLDGFSDFIFNLCEGVISAFIYIVDAGEAVLISNNGSLFYGHDDFKFIFSSEITPLKNIGITNARQIKGSHGFKLPEYVREKVTQHSYPVDRVNLVPLVDYNFSSSQVSNQGSYLAKSLRRCAVCILPESMPFIVFNGDGICNYCTQYKPQRRPLGSDELMTKMADAIRNGKFVMPFSGGRDSSYALHLVVNELGLSPVTYTYDWGMVTDLGRRNISRMCSKLGVENIVVADDIKRNRDDVRKNLIAWLKAPNLGMLNILTAAEKHFFRYNNEVCRRLNAEFNIWGTCPFETTHFKSGFLGIPPYFAENSVYSSGILSQVRYQARRFAAMLHSPGYFNSSIFRNLLGEYYRSLAPKVGYIHIFDYFPWIESDINRVLLEKYDWELSADTSTTWRIGDASAAFYNYVYFHSAGFSEHDTFRSNQIREGHISRDKALELVASENLPRLANIKWYLDVLDLPFEDVMRRVNSIPPVLV